MFLSLLIATKGSLPPSTNVSTKTTRFLVRQKIRGCNTMRSRTNGSRFYNSSRRPYCEAIRNLSMKNNFVTGANVNANSMIHNYRYPIQAARYRRWGRSHFSSNNNNNNKSIEQCVRDLSEITEAVASSNTTVTTSNQIQGTSADTIQLINQLSSTARNEISLLAANLRKHKSKASAQASATATTATATEAPAAAAATAAQASEAVIAEPTFKELRMLAFANSIPFVGFGFLDNAVLLVAGDAIDTWLGVSFGISTLCAAAIGNIISDLAGIGFGTVIEDFCARYMKIPIPNLSNAQRQLRSVRFANQFGMAVGITIGCIIGMFPLLFIDTKKIEHMKKEHRLDQLFLDVVNEAKTLISAQTTTLFLLVDDPSGHRPTPTGKYLYAKYFDDHIEKDAAAITKEVPPSSSKEKEKQPRELTTIKTQKVIPLGRGIISRAMSTGESVNIYDAENDPDFVPEIHEEMNELWRKAKVKNIIYVPIKNSEGRPIAIIQAINKQKISTNKIIGEAEEEETIIETGVGFTNRDVRILKSLATHISVSLQTLLHDDDEAEEEMHLKDTIRLMKQQALSTVAEDDEGGQVEKKETKM